MRVARELELIIGSLDRAFLVWARENTNSRHHRPASPLTDLRDAFPQMEEARGRRSVNYHARVMPA